MTRPHCVLRIGNNILFYVQPEDTNTEVIYKFHKDRVPKKWQRYVKEQKEHEDKI